MTKVRPLQVAWHVYKNYLNGIFCIYKPVGMSTKNAVCILKRNILKELNELPAYEHEVDEYFKDRFSLSSADSKTSVVNSTQSALVSTKGGVVSTKSTENIKDFSKHKRVLGDMFLTDKVPMSYLHNIQEQGSGVVVCGIGRKGLETLKLIQLAKYLRVYHVKGRFGYATDSFFPSGNFIERTTYKHITKGKVDKFCGSSQSLHQRMMFEYAGIDPTSEEAYQLACQGLIRPADDNMPPMLYGVKCIYFNPPDFTLEVHAINETTSYLGELVNDIGLKLKSTAVCTHVHRLRYGIFDLDYTLLQKEWHLPNIIRNITKCESVLTPDKLMTSIQLDSASRDTRTDLLGSGTSTDGASVKDILEAKKREKFEQLQQQIRKFSLEDCNDSSTSVRDDSSTETVSVGLKAK